VIVEKTTIGTTTDIDGKYTLAGVPNDAKNLLVSYTGMKTKVVLITGTTLDVTLDENEKLLDDVVVTALGVKREQKALGYATQLVKGDDINTAKDANLVNNLQGKIAGVQITGNSNIGGSSRITIRGIKSLTGENQPLFVIDGVVIDNSNFVTADAEQGALGRDYGNAAQDINADDIESVNVLKGGAAAALYGSRGANGVIVITTKHGSKHSTEKGKSPIGVTVSENMMFNQVAVLPDYQNEYGAGYGPTFRNDEENPGSGQVRLRMIDDASWGPKIDGSLVRQYNSYDPFDKANYGKPTPYVAHPDNIKDFFRTGYIANTNISMDGANDKGAFRLSYSNLDQQGTVENSSLKRNTVSFNGSYNFTDKLYANLSVTYVQNNGFGRPQIGYNSLFSNFTQWWQRQLDMKDLRNYKNPDGSQRGWNLARGSQNPDGTYNWSSYFWDNPYWTVYENYANDRRDRVFGNTEVGWKILKWLTAKAKVSTDYYSETREERVAVGSASAGGVIPGYSIEQIMVNENNYEGTLNANHSFKDIFDISALIGMNRRDQTERDNFSTTQGGLNVPGLYTLENSTDKVGVNNYRGEKRVNSVFGSASFGFKHMLYLDITARNDWSSALPANNNSYFYPSVSGSFVFSELIKKNKILSFGKIRGGWALVGNDTRQYRLETRPSVSYSFGTQPIYVVPNTFNNLGLRPEKINTWEVGLDLGFFNDRIRIDAAYYQSLTTDNIFRVEQSGASGITNRYVNAGSMENKGVELATTLIPVRTKGGFTWTVGFNFGKNWNTVKELYKDESGNAVTSLQLGSAPFSCTLEARPGMAYGQIVGYDFVYDKNGNKMVGADGNYLQSSTVKPLGSILPDFTGGINTTLAYKGLSLYLLFDFQQGGNIFSLTNMWGTYDGTLAITAANHVREDSLIATGVKQTGVDANGNPTSDGTKNDVKISALDFYQNGTGNGYYGPQKTNVYDASFVKWRELKIMYALPTKWFNNSPIRGISLGLIARNILILKKNAPNIDPEVANSTSNVQGFEGGAKPTERSIGFSFSVKF
jgi:TonB-linked SusC/RagA family outer membrane protein